MKALTFLLFLNILFFYSYGQVKPKSLTQKNKVSKKDSSNIYSNNVIGTGNTIVNGNLTKQNITRVDKSKKNYTIYKGVPKDIIRIYPKKNVKKDNIKILIGGGDCLISREKFVTGGVLANGCFNIGGGVEPVEIKIIKDLLYVSAKIYDIDNKIVGELIDNKFLKNANNIYQVGKDSNSLEVIDQYDIPVLQIKYIDNNTIWLGGALSNLTGVIFAYENSMTSMRKDSAAVRYFVDKLHTTAKDLYLERGRKLKRIFEY